MSKDKLIPEIRFPEFKNEGQWDEKNLIDICYISNGKANAQDHVENGKYPLFDRSEVIKCSNEFIFDSEAVIIPGEGMRFTPKYFEGKFNLHQRAYALKDFKCSGKFVYYSMLHRSALISQKAVQSTVLSLRLPILQKFPLEIPKNPKEQKKIASCLSSLDEVIAAHSQKLDLLKDHKKGLMQNLFPQEGETVPKYRFMEFENDGEWLEEPLSSKVTVIDGDRGVNYPKAEEYSSDGYCVFLSAKNVTKNGFVFNEIQFITKEKDELLRKGQLSRFDIVLTTRGSLGQFAFYDQNIPFENIRINSGMVILRAKHNKINPYYLYSYFNSNSIQTAIKSQGFGNAVQQLTVVVINNFTLRYPKNPNEQQKIASCLFSLDALIMAQAEKIEQLKLHKTGLMQGLFPNIND